MKANYSKPPPRATPNFPHNVHINLEPFSHHSKRSNFPSPFVFLFCFGRCGRMATKPDFAQKLLSDLRVRKERMAAAQNSSRQSSQTSRVTRGNSGQTSRGGRQMNVLDSTGSTTGSTSRRSTGSSRSSFNTKESSSQIVLYEGGQSSRQVRDLSMAIAFAFENSGNLGTSSSNPLVNFFNRFGRRSSNSRKMETSSFYSNRASGQFPTVSNIHINEISKGVHKLNQILSACSNGLNLDRNSIEIGRELLKGAVDLEESLRMLVNFQEASEYTNGSKKKSRIKLLEEDEDDEDHNEKRVEQWKLSRPKFSFDKTSANSRSVQGATRRQQLALPYKHETLEESMSDSKLVPHKTFNSYVQDFSVSTHNYTSSSKSTQEKVRISNVIAKLMGLEEIPIKDGTVGGKNDQNGKEWKQGKVSRDSSKQNVPLTRESRNGSDLTTNKKLNSTSTTLPRRESKLQNKPEKSQETLDNGSRLVNSEKNQSTKDLKMQAVGMEAKPDPKPGNTVMKKQQNHTNYVNGLKSSEDSLKKQTHREDKQGKTVEREGKKLVLNVELQKRAQNSKISKGEDKTINRIEQEVSANSGEKRNGNNYLAKTQRKVQDQQALLQDQLPKIPDHSEEKNQKPQQLQKQNLITNLYHIIDDSHRFAAKESPKTEGQSHDSSNSESESQINVEKGSSNPADEKPIEISATQKRTVAGKVQRREIPVSFLHAGDHENEVPGRKVVLDSAYEVMKRKARHHEFTHNPYMKTSISNIKLKSLDDLVRHLCKDMEMLKSYGVNGSDESDVAAGLHKMLNKDIYNEVPDVNCMWDFEWSRMMSIFPEMEVVVKDVERHMLNGLLDEITNDLVIITISV